MSLARPAYRVFRPDIRRDVDDELTSHIEMRRQELIARGMAPAEAREMALRRFGDLPAIARECREINQRAVRAQRRTSMGMDLRQDLTYALRLLARAPGFTAVAVCTLALGIGATTAIFSLANWALLRPIPGVERPHEVQQVWGGVRTSPTSMRMSGVSYPNLLDLTPRLQTIDLAGHQSTEVNVATGAAAARAMPAEFVSAGYFPLLGVTFLEGRPFSAAEDNPAGADPVVVVSEVLSRELRRTHASVLGQVLTVNGLPFTIVGVVGSGFEGTNRFGGVSLWLPGASAPAVNHFQGVRYDDRSRGSFLHLLARLKNGATWAQADAELTSLAAWLRLQHPKENAKFEQTRLHLMGPIGEQPLGEHASTVRTLALMLGVSALVLFIACSNIASLLLMRGLGRGGEVAVRKALGAARLRIVRQHLTEGLLLWGLGGATGLLLVWALLQTVDGGVLLGLRGAVGTVPLDGRVVVFAALLSLSVGLVFSIVPAFRASRAEAAETLKEGSASVTHRNLRVGSVLTTLQLATSLTLVVGALLLTATIRELSRVDLGFQPNHLYAFSVRPVALGYTSERAAIYREEFARRLRQVPGVEQVATVIWGVPFVKGTIGTRVRAQGGGEFLEPDAAQIISPGYFETLHIPLRTGRLFTAEDLGLDGRAVRPVVVLSETAARQLFGTTDAVGRRVEYRIIGRVGKSYEVIGVVGDVRMDSLTGPMEPMVYEPAALGGPVRAEATFLVRTTEGVNVAAQASMIGAALDPALPIGPVRTMNEAIGRARAEWDVLARLMTTLAAIAGLLAAVGLYGVMAFGVAARRREFGIRLALGAPPAQLVGLVLRQTALIAGVGLVLGLGGAAALSRSLGSRLFGVGPFDPLAWGMATAVFLLIALVASWWPARRAAYVDPVSALRSN